MPRGGHKSILYLCTGNYYRSRFAEALFNSVASKMWLPWQASSRGLALERGVNNIGPMSRSALESLERLGAHSADACGRLPIAVCADDFEQAHLVVALDHDEHRPLLQERFPDWTERVEYWRVRDDDQALPLIEQAVMDQVARLMGGGGTPPPAEPEPIPSKKTDRPPAQVVRLSRETKGRRGKGVTVVSGLALDDAQIQELAATLKQRCGTGGAVKDGRIEIQGDLRDRVAAVLEQLGYKTKRSGG